MVEVETSFDAFMATEHRRVLALARAMTGSWSEAEDVAQEAFLAAYRQWGTMTSPEAFVRRVVLNQSASGVRRKVRERSALGRLRVVASREDDDVADPAFWRAVAALPTRQRQVVALHYVDDRSVADVAEILGVTEGTVKTTLHDARASLRARFEEERP